MVNGFGIAIAGQGDRFVVGSLLGLQALGLYNVVLMVTVVPISMVFRLMGTTNLAAFYNASTSVKLLEQRVRLAGELSPLVATVYALGVAALMNVVTPLVFGARFAIGRMEISLLALAAFVKIIRVEPFTSLLLLQQRTKRLAASNLAALSALAFSFRFYRSQSHDQRGFSRSADGRGDEPRRHDRAGAGAVRRQLGPLWLRGHVRIRHRCDCLCCALVFAARSRPFVRSRYTGHRRRRCHPLGHTSTAGVQLRQRDPKFRCPIPANDQVSQMRNDDPIAFRFSRKMMTTQPTSEEAA